MVDRIKKIMEYKNLTPGEFAEQLEINRSNLTHLFSGRNQPSLPFIKKILDTYPDISTEWLMMGMGNMLKTELQQNPTSTVKNNEPELALDNEPDLFSSIEEPAVVTPQETTNTVVENETEVEEITEEPEAEQEVETVSQVNPQPVVSEPTPRKRITSKKANNSGWNTSRSQICDSRGDKKVKKIVFFYVNNTFEEFYPE